MSMIKRYLEWFPENYPGVPFKYAKNQKFFTKFLKKYRAKDKNEKKVLQQS